MLNNLDPLYEIYIIFEKDGPMFLRGWTNNIDVACDLAEKKEKELNAYASLIYDDVNDRYFGYHVRGQAYIIAK